MTTQALYQLLQLPQDVIDRLNGCAQSDLNWLTPRYQGAVLEPRCCRRWPKAIQTTLGEDPDGMRLLWVLLEIARDTWDGYMQRGIGREIFADTMKFVPRACEKMSVKG